MESAVVVYDAVGHVELRAFQELPHDLIVAYLQPPSFVEDFSSSPTTTDNIKKVRLSRHRLLNVSGGVTRELTAFWPESWSDVWGVEEVDKFIKREEARVGSPSATQQNSGSAHLSKAVESHS